MKDATYFAEIACREMTGDEQVKFRPLIYNLFLQAQAEAFLHAADVAEDQLARSSVPGLLRQHAAHISPAHKPPVATPSNEDAKSDTPDYVPESPESST